MSRTASTIRSLGFQNACAPFSIFVSFVIWWSPSVVNLYGSDTAQRSRSAHCQATRGLPALRNKTYPLRMILSALTDYDAGFTLEETAARLKKKTHRNVSPSRIASWLEQYRHHCGYRRLRAQGLSRFPATPDDPHD